jgi:hypothetical protein
MRYYWCVVAGLATLPAIGFLSCSSSAYKEVYPALLDNRYDSEFPYRNCSKQLEEIADCVKMVSTVAYYRTYYFSTEERVRAQDLTATYLQSRERESVFINKSMSGTATIIFAEGRRVALLTCAHTLAFPDTALSYHLDSEGHPTLFVKSVSLKERQMNFVGMLPEGGELEILAMDKANDIALLGKVMELAPTLPLPVFRYPVGHARELEWGSFVYLFGYPSGYRIVTKGIVSDPNRDKRRSFLVDAVFGGGFSGGIALAVRDGVPNFELVGMVKMVTARSSYIVSPRHDDETLEYDPTVPYRGEVYAERRTDIEYGVSQAISAESIVEFLEINRPALEERGFRIVLGRPPDQQPM